MAMSWDETDGPRYRQIAERLRRRIRDGRYRDGSQLPTEAQLGREFGVSRITVRGALERLAAEGLLRRERGRGTFVAAPPVEQALDHLTDFAEDMAAAGLRPASRVVHLAEEPAGEAVAAELDVPTGTTVTRLDRLRLADDRPLAFDRTYLPLRYGRLLDREALAGETLLHQLEGQYAIPIAGGHYAIEAIPAAGEVAGILGIPAGAPVLLLHRSARASGGERVFYQQRHYRGDRVRYTLDLGRWGQGTRPRLVALAPPPARD